MEYVDMSGLSSAMRADHPRNQRPPRCPRNRCRSPRRNAVGFFLFQSKIENPRSKLPRSRGSAEIELLLSIMTLMMIFYVALSVGKLQKAHVRMMAKANYQAYHEALQGGILSNFPSFSPWAQPVSPQYPNVPSTIPSLNMLPNKIVTGSARENVRTFDSQDSHSIKVQRSSITMIGPWTYSGDSMLSMIGNPVPGWYRQLYGEDLRKSEAALKISSDN